MARIRARSRQVSVGQPPSRARPGPPARDAPTANGRNTAVRSAEGPGVPPARERGGRRTDRARHGHAGGRAVAGVERARCHVRRDGPPWSSARSLARRHGPPDQCRPRPVDRHPGDAERAEHQGAGATSPWHTARSRGRRGHGPTPTVSPSTRVSIPLRVTDRTGSDRTGSDRTGPGRAGPGRAAPRRAKVPGGSSRHASRGLLQAGRRAHGREARHPPVGRVTGLPSGALEPRGQACSAVFSWMPSPFRCRASTAPVREFRRNRMFGASDSSAALTVRGVPSGFGAAPTSTTLVPAVT